MLKSKRHPAESGSSKQVLRGWFLSPDNTANCKKQDLMVSGCRAPLDTLVAPACFDDLAHNRP